MGKNKKHAYGFLPERMDMFNNLFTIDTQMIHGLTVRTRLLNKYESRCLLEKSVTLFRVFCALRINDNVKKH